MDSVLAILSGSATLGSLALVAYLIVKLVSMSEALSDARQAQSTTEEHLEEANFKLVQIQAALASSQKAVDIEAKELTDNDAKPINQDLAPGDLHGRLDRLFSSWAAGDAAAASASAHVASVPAPAAADAPRKNPG